MICFKRWAWFFKSLYFPSNFALQYLYTEFFCHRLDLEKLLLWPLHSKFCILVLNYWHFCTRLLTINLGLQYGTMSLGTCFMEDKRIDTLKKNCQSIKACSLSCRYLFWIDSTNLRNKTHIKHFFWKKNNTQDYMNIFCHIDLH